MSDWKPGDVAMVTHQATHPKAKVGLRGDAGWFTADVFVPDAAVVTAHRLVVIDPEDREQVERLASIYYGKGWHNTYLHVRPPMIDAMQAALREFANPTPRIEEPKGLGAVVRDVHGELWVRDKTTTTVAHWKRARGQMGGKRVSWSDINAVRVLSEGVSDD